MGVSERQVTLDPEDERDVTVDQDVFGGDDRSCGAGGDQAGAGEPPQRSPRCPDADLFRDCVDEVVLGEDRSRPRASTSTVSTQRV
jgi:hypothetical protein